ncbi:MAG: hypothetical protein ACR2PW_04590 [Gammaproteobacteria bacterium]
MAKRTGMDALIDRMEERDSRAYQDGLAEGRRQAFLEVVDLLTLAVAEAKGRSAYVLLQPAIRHFRHLADRQQEGKKDEE